MILLNGFIYDFYFTNLTALQPDRKINETSF